MPLPLLDNFNRANENPIVGYTKVIGGVGDELQILDNQLCGTSDSPAICVKDGTSFGNDQEAYCTIATVATTPGRIIEIVLRYNGTNFYYAELGVALGPVYTIRLLHDSGAVSGLISLGVVPQPGSVFGARIFGSRFEAFLDGQILVGRTTTLIPSGYGVGIGCESAEWRLDDFSAGSIAIPTQFNRVGKRLASFSPVYV